MALLDRKMLLTRQKLEIVKVDLTDGDFVYVRQMTGRERDLFEQSLLKETTKDGKLNYERSLGDFRAKLAVVTICDESGTLLLQPKDYEVLSQSMTAANLERIVNEAQRINKIAEEDKEALIKNSDAVQDGNSNSDSVEN